MTAQPVVWRFVIDVEQPVGAMLAGERMQMVTERVNAVFLYDKILIRFEP
jgi:hypothetical protein